MSKRPILMAMLLMGLTATSASGQLLGGSGPLGGAGGGLGGMGVGQTVGGVGNTVGQTVGGVTDRVGQSVGGIPGSPADRIGRSTAVAPITLDHFAPPPEFLQLSSGDMANWRQLRLDALIRANPTTLDRDQDGQPVRKDRLIAMDPDAASLAAAQRAGFRLISSESVDELGLRVVTLALPKGMNVRKGLKVLREAAPALQCQTSLAGPANRPTPRRVPPWGPPRDAESRFASAWLRP